MSTIKQSLAELFERIPRRHSTDNVKEIYSIADEYEEFLTNIEAENDFYEKQVPAFFDQLDQVRSAVKKSTDSKASKKNKDIFFDEAAGTLKDSVQALIELYGDGGRKAWKCLGRFTGNKLK